MLPVMRYLAFFQIVKSVETFLVERNRVAAVLDNLLQSRLDSGVESVVHIRFHRQCLFKQCEILFIFHLDCLRDRVKYSLSSFHTFVRTCWLCP